MWNRLLRVWNQLRPPRSLVMVWIAILALVCQGIAQVPPSTQLDKYGQWQGPYDLSGTQTNQIDSNTWAEITHVALVPPHANNLTHPYVGRLLFWCRRHFCDPVSPCPSCPNTNICPPQGPAALYAWSIRSPQSVTKLAIPDTSSSVDPFCSGHT